MKKVIKLKESDLIKNHAKNPKDLRFLKTFEKAQSICNNNGGDFLTVFIDTHKEMNKGLPLNYLFKGESIGVKSSDDDVETYFRKLIGSSILVGICQ